MLFLHRTAGIIWNNPRTVLVREEYGIAPPRGCKRTNNTKRPLGGTLAGMSFLAGTCEGPVSTGTGYAARVDSDPTIAGNLSPNWRKM